MAGFEPTVQVTQYRVACLVNGRTVADVLARKDGAS